MSSFNYISSLELKNFLSNDPILDWLESYGHLHNYYPEQSDPDKIFNQFLQENHSKFQKKIIEHLESKLSITRIEHYLDIRQKVSNTLNAFYLGKEIIYQGALFSNSHHFISYPDLLIRSDLIPSLFPTLETSSEKYSSKFNWTYYVVNIQTLKLHLNHEGYITNMNKRNQYLKAKNIIDTLCLNEIQECHHPLSFIISKSIQKSPDLKTDFKDFLYGRVDYQNYDRVIYENILKGCQWKQKLKKYGSEWSPENTDYQQKEMWPDAELVYTEIVSKFPQSDRLPDVLFNLGEINFALSDVDEAAIYYKHITDKYRKSPIYPYAAYKLGWCFYN